MADIWIKKCHAFFNALETQTGNPSPEYIPVFIMGNQAADADSIIGAISLSWIYNEFIINNNPDNYLYCPLISCKRTELNLRKDVIYMLDKYNIDHNDLLFYDDEIIQSYIRAANINPFKLIMVDHNKPDTVSSLFSNNGVLQIIDHHKDEHLFKNAAVRIIDSCIGSTCSLLTHMFFNGSSTMYISNKIPHESQLLLANLFLHVIMIDTKNLQGRYSDDDVIAVDTLCQLLLSESQPFYNNKQQLLQSIYETMHKHRIDISGLSLIQLLGKDFKKYNHESGLIYGMSTVPATFKYCLSLSSCQDSSFISVLDYYCNLSNINIYIIKFYGNRHRKMLIYLPHSISLKMPHLHTHIFSSLLPLIGYNPCNSAIIDNFLSFIKSPDIFVFREPNQPKDNWSRKVVQPKVHQWLTRFFEKN